MTQGQVKTGSVVTRGTSKKTSNESCLGEYCSLIHTLDPNRDVIQQDGQDVRIGKAICNEMEGRDRAFSVVKRLLTKSEVDELEESGKWIHLGIADRIRPFYFLKVPKESVMMSRREHRLAFLELIKAEDVTLPTLDLCTPCKEHDPISSSCRENWGKNASDENRSVDKSASSNMIPVCEMCFHVYRLLSHTRCLVASNYTSTPLGKAEEEVFGLHDISRKSNQMENKTPTKTRRPMRRFNVQSEISQTRQLKSIEEQRKKPKERSIGENRINSSPAIPIDNATGKRRKMRKCGRSTDTETRRVKKASNVTKRNASHKSNSNESSEDTSTIFYYDDKTSFPYTIIRSSSGAAPKIEDSSGLSRQQMCNLVVCHDLFDTQERIKIFLSSFVEENPGHEILLWNYPGQAFTSFSKAHTLNNKFHADCLDKLLVHVGLEGTNEFDSTKPFYLLAHGHGGSVACSYAAKHQYIPGLRGICLINPLSFIDTHFASVMHDCRNVFSCSPETRPDLPLYFYSRFVFSKEYLQKVSTALALNLYTAVHNPISVQGRIGLCDGVLNNTDLRGVVKNIRAPIISIHGNHSELVRPLHASTFLEGRKLCSTIHNVLDQKGVGRKTILIMTEGGHELLQEKKKTVLALIGELLTGFHDVKDIRGKQKQKSRISSSLEHWNGGRIAEQAPQIVPCQSIDHDKASQSEENIERHKVNEIESKQRKPLNEKGTAAVDQKVINIVLDPKNPSFERQQNFVYKPGTGAIYPSSNEHVKAQEYMSWRLKRNKKRLSRFQKAARVIQGSLRVYMAKTMISRLKRQRSALNIQRCFRGMLGRRIFTERMKELWAAQLVQRAYRGALGRRTSYYRRMSIQAQINIARVWRGYVDRQRVNKIVAHRNFAAINLQSLWRRCMAIDLAQRLRERKFASITIQRIFRGYRGRKKADLERDKYIFSKSQSMGIELGRKMLAEHKFQATRLQSELNILEKERSSIESKVDTITNELDEFQLHAKKLEKTMHEISLVEAQKRSNFAAQQVLREKKVQLDQDFGRLLSKISDRKNQLTVFEEKISILDKSKKQKTEQLRKLERKLVAILEAQENELAEIRRKQDQKIETIAQSGVFPPSNSNRTSSNPQSIVIAANEKRKAAKLMDSTETMMKFGFMSMAMTYFTSMNMVGAMKNVSSKEIKELDKEALQWDLTESVNKRPKEVASKQPRSNVTNWNIDNVSQWLSAIYLGQYEEAFRDASIDGPFLCQLTNEDLKNALGIEHILHRKKILFSIEKLKSNLKDESSFAQTSTSRKLDTPLQIQETVQNTKNNLDPMKLDMIEDEIKSEDIVEIQRMTVTVDELSKWIRNQKDGKIKESLQHLPDRTFDESNIRVQFVDGVGTAYIKSLDDQRFHINKCDEHGNTLMHIAAQNGNMKMAMFLINKGANPNHQNKQGQTPGHFALSYQFYDFASWLFDPDGGKGNDLLTNIYGLGPYDGLVDDE